MTFSKLPLRYENSKLSFNLSILKNQTFESVPPSERTTVSCQLDELVLKHRRVGKDGLLTIHLEGGQLDLSAKGIPVDIKSRVLLTATSVFFVPNEEDMKVMSSARTSFSQLAKVFHN